MWKGTFCGGGGGFTPPPTQQWKSYPDPNGWFVWLFAYVFRFLLGVDFWNDVGDFPIAKWNQDRPSWGILGRSWGRLGGVLGRLGASWGRLGSSWEHLGEILEVSWVVLGRLGSVVGAS